ncbi:MAG: M3 family oligoendopeptidase [Defluviitaleaceae bacterium]|nr:M3 family oligoendopeptidase [Defluviitaleaceae bacterium]MCL2274964.1 M3 family oligoendopeptidase [Defluviitaleaceae bacterium]
MKFSQMPYERPQFDAVLAQMEGLLAEFKAAKSADDAFAAYKKYDDATKELFSAISIGRIRHTLDTNDKFYDGEKAYFDEMLPKLQPAMKAYTQALLDSPFRAELEKAWGTLLFDNAELQLKTFKPEIVPDLQEENRLSSEYSKLIASAQIEFDGKTLTLAQIRPYSEHPDRAMRKAAVEATGAWFMERAEKFDTLFDELVKVRTRIAEKLGHTHFTQVGYYRMQRNCYDQAQVAKFREGVINHIVPVALRLKNEQKQRIGVDSLKFYDDAFEYPEGNAKPMGTPEDIFAHGKKMYHELSDETAQFIDFMLENELFDVLTRPGKQAGGYCASIPKYKSPFIFANFNGTAGDIDVLTHEAGHAFAGYLAKDIYPSALRYYSMETAEVHSMAMEFFTWPWVEGFFGDATQKYYQQHLGGALTFIPYGVMVDEFQHHMYNNPELTPARRNALWLELEAKYRPWLDLTETPFYGEGRRWQAQGHIFSSPFYYIDYCLAQIMALSFWADAQKDAKSAWEKYRRLVGFAGTKTFVELVQDAGLPTPFEADNVKTVADAAVEWLDGR